MLMTDWMALILATVTAVCIVVTMVLALYEAWKVEQEKKELERMQERWKEWNPDTPHVIYWKDEDED